MGTWTLDDIPWDQFDRSKLDPEMVKIAKAACMVEHHSADYGKYLCGVFHDDPGFCADALAWAEEEVQHGAALRRYAELADPSFDFDATFARFVAGHPIDTDASDSIRGSRCGEMVARCIVEVGTSAHYSALRDAAEEPVFKAICKRIAGDEFRHYKLFYTTMKRYRDIEGVGRLSRARVAHRAPLRGERRRAFVRLPLRRRRARSLRSSPRGPRLCGAHAAALPARPRAARRGHDAEIHRHQAAVAAGQDHRRGGLGRAQALCPASRDGERYGRNSAITAS